MKKEKVMFMYMMRMNGLRLRCCAVRRMDRRAGRETTTT